MRSDILILSDSTSSESTFIGALEIATISSSTTNTSKTTPAIIDTSSDTENMTIINKYYQK